MRVKKARSAALGPRNFNGLAEPSDRGFIWGSVMLGALLAMRLTNISRNFSLTLFLLISSFSSLQAHEPTIHWNSDDNIFFCEGQNFIQISEHIQKNYTPFNFKFVIDTDRQVVTYKSEIEELNVVSTLLVAYISGNKPTIIAQDAQSVFGLMSLSGRNLSWSLALDENTWLITAVCDQF